MVVATVGGTTAEPPKEDRVTIERELDAMFEAYCEAKDAAKRKLEAEHPAASLFYLEDDERYKDLRRPKTPWDTER